MLSNDQMIQAVKSSLYLPTLPGRFEALDIPNVDGRYGFRVYGGFINRVGNATLPVAQMGDTVQAVIKHFAALKQSFSWFTTPTDTPPELEAHLQAVGFERGWTMSGMVLADLDQDFPTHPNVTVRPARRDERHLVSDVYLNKLIWDKGAADLFAELMVTHYLVFLDGVDEPVGATSAFYVEDYQAVILESAVILDAYRGQGIYQSLIAQRLRDAYRDGMRLAIVQANVETSAPGLRKLGFVDTCPIREWEWSPFKRAG